MASLGMLKLVNRVAFELYSQWWFWSFVDFMTAKSTNDEKRKCFVPVGLAADAYFATGCWRLAALLVETNSCCEDAKMMKPRRTTCWAEEMLRLVKMRVNKPDGAGKTTLPAPGSDDPCRCLCEAARHKAGLHDGFLIERCSNDTRSRDNKTDFINFQLWN